MTTRTITVEALLEALPTLTIYLDPDGGLHVDRPEDFPAFARNLFAALPAEPAGAGLRAALETLANDNEYDGPVFGATVRRIARAALAVTPVGEGPVLDVERLARALEAADKVIVDNDYGIVTDTGDIEEVAAAYAAVPDGEGEEGQ